MCLKLLQNFHWAQNFHRPTNFFLLQIFESIKKSFFAEITLGKNYSQKNYLNGSASSNFDGSFWLFLSYLQTAFYNYFNSLLGINIKNNGFNGSTPQKLETRLCGNLLYVRHRIWMDFIRSTLQMDL